LHTHADASLEPGGACEFARQVLVAPLVQISLAAQSVQPISVLLLLMGR
jgi:hypothetical protein